jgi:5-methylcytosine-specific restriction endonuclease McrA
MLNREMCCIKSWKKYYKKKMNDILQNKVNFPTSKLRIRLFEEGYKEKRCEKCGQTSWLNELIPLELHRVDGNNKNNLIENLQILCPNCHALTDTYKGKNMNRNPKKI